MASFQAKRYAAHSTFFLSFSILSFLYHFSSRTHTSMLGRKSKGFGFVCVSCCLWVVPLLSGADADQSCAACIRCRSWTSYLPWAQDLCFVCFVCVKNKKRCHQRCCERRKKKQTACAKECIEPRTQECLVDRARRLAGVHDVLDARDHEALGACRVVHQLQRERVLGRTVAVSVQCV